MLMWFNPLGLCPAGKGFNRFNIRSGFLRSCVPLEKERVFQRSGCSSKFQVGRRKCGGTGAAAGASGLTLSFFRRSSTSDAAQQSTQMADATTGSGAGSSGGGPAEPGVADGDAFTVTDDAAWLGALVVRVEALATREGAPAKAAVLHAQKRTTEILVW